MVLGRVGLTGATGMLGRHIRAALEAAGAVVVPMSRSGRDGTSQWDMTKWLSRNALDTLFGDVSAVVHAGAIVDSAASESHACLFDANVRGCANLAEWALSRSIALVFISSASVYADPDAGRLPEDAPLGANPLGGYYGMTKLMAEDLLGRYRLQGLNLAVVRPSSLYGHGGPPTKMLYRFLDLASRGETINLIPPVDDYVDFLHAADLSRAVVRVLERACWETLNIASEKPISIREVALACVEVAGRGKVNLPETEPAERAPLRRFFLDATRARESLGWTSTIGIQRGMEMVLAGQFLPRHARMPNQAP